MKIPFVVLFINSFTLFSQQDLFFPMKDEFDWNKIEKQNDVLKQQLIQQWKDEFDEDNLPNVRPAIYAEEDSYENHLHVIDFNKDGLDDLVYEGPTNGEASFVFFYQNTGDNFKIVLEEYQEIFKLEFQDGRVSKVFLKDQGCCCSYKGQNKVLIADYDFDVKFEILSVSSFCNLTELPVKYLKTPYKINIKTPIALQMEPNEKDSLLVEWCPHKEIIINSIAEIPANSFAWCLAEKTDKGTDWIYVAIFPETRLTNSMFAKYFSNGVKQSSNKLGWIEKESATVVQ